MNPKREQARELRRQGLSVKEIVDLIGVTKNSVRTWTRDIELTPDQLTELKQRHPRHEAQQKGANANHERGLKLRQRFQEAGRQKAREKSLPHLMGCMLYWAEGAKRRNELYFVNSDTHMLMTFMRFLLEEMRVEKEIIKLNIHCHATDPVEINRIENYWLDLFQLSRSCLNKTQIKKGTVIHNNVLQNGLCGIRITKAEVVQHIFGAIQEYTGLDNPDWLFPDRK